jgi:hypothetical protein
MWMMVEGSVVTLAILFEDLHREHQLGLQAVIITESSGSMHKSRQYHLFIGWVMVGLGVKVEIGVCVCVLVGGLVVHIVSQRAIKSPVNI